MIEAPDLSPLAQAVADATEPDAHGQATLLLSESILHALVETHALTTDEALSFIQTTCEVKVEIAHRSGESNKPMEESLALLQVMSTSFKACPSATTPYLRSSESRPSL